MIFFVPQEQENKPEDSRLHITILAYNVAGLKYKTANVDFVNFLKRYDVLFLLETFIEEESDFIKWQNILNGYELRFTPAERHSRYGRASGGEMYGLKRKRSFKGKLSFYRMCNFNAVRLEDEGAVSYILPIYLNINHWTNDFERLRDVVANNSNKNLVLIGDFNGRISDKQVIPEEIISMSCCQLSACRLSKDKEINANGKKLLAFMEDFNFIILNGRTQGDENGELTFLGGQGSSVIDLCLVTEQLIKHIISFTVGDEMFSDHFPVTVRICMSGLVEESRGTQNMLPKIRWIQEDKHRFQLEVQRKVEEMGERELTVEGTCRILTDILKEGAAQRNYNSNKKTYTQLWFDDECYGLRTEIFNLLKLYRRTDSPYVREQYLTRRNEYKKTCREKKKEYWKNCYDAMKKVQNAGEFWRALRCFRKSKIICDNDINIIEWVSHFKNLLNIAASPNIILYAEPYIVNEALDTQFSFNELDIVLKNSKDNKAPGEDRIPYELYKSAPIEFLNKLITFYNTVFDTGDVPVNFKKAVIFPIYKKGCPNEVTNYRGISFCNTIGKIFTGLLLNRLVKYLETTNLLKEFQAGFRKGYSTIDNIFALTSIIKIKLSTKRQKVYAFFVDLTAAFDHVDRRALFYKLSGYGISAKFINVIKTLYTGSTATVWIKNSLTEEFETSTGVKQGCLLSPILFSLFINDVDEFLEGGIDVCGKKVKLLAYADDLVLMASDRRVLQKMICDFKDYCDTWNLRVNLTKSKIVVFRNGGRLAGDERWTFGGEEIEVVNNYKYLGLNLSPTLSLESHFIDQGTKARFALNSLSNVVYSDSTKLQDKILFFKAVSRSILCYSAQVWGYAKFGRVEAVLKFFIKRVFSLPVNTPDYIVYLETGQLPVFLFTLRLHLSYINRCYNLPISRYPKIFMEQIFSKKLYWYQEWVAISNHYGVPLEYFSLQNLRIEDILTVIKGRMEDSFRDMRMNSGSRSIYKELQLSVNYLNSEEHFQLVKWMMKARTELIYLNKYSFTSTSKDCSLCNLAEEEDIVHFIARCPILTEIRIKCFNKRILDLEDLKESLNGKDWTVLALYCKLAWQYRYELIREFNY
jgi:exonuclease III